ncbi:MAG TPA: tetratricopeptide repeat protein [Rickettsia endosymbiont of Omalisus fontisbellaquei]|nr:tetratricopeptide repeat protein [Rickettsia endosymbiont of Omalisus fontisbellaquei]
MNNTKEISSNIARYSTILKLCDKLIRENQFDANVFNLKIYKNGMASLSEALEINLEKKKLLESIENKNEETLNNELIEKYEVVINLLEKFIKPKQEAKHYYKQGVELYNSGEHEKALIAFDEAISINPHSIYYYNKGKTLEILNKPEEAIIAYDKAINLNPDYYQAYNEKGSILAFLGKYTEAIKLYNKAIKLKGDYAEPYNNKGRSLYELGRYEEAVICFAKATNLNPNLKAAILNKNQTLTYLKNRTIQTKAKDLLKRVSNISLIGR